jgi:integrase
MTSHHLIDPSPGCNMPRMGRKRKVHKDIPPGSWRVPGRHVIPWRATNEREAQRMVALFGKNAYTLGVESDLDAVWASYWALKAKLNAIDSAQKPVGTISELVADYQVHAMPRLASKTQTERKRHLKEIEAEFGAMRFATSAHEAVTGPFLRLMHVQKYLADNVRRPVAANHVVRALAQVFVVARQQGRTEYSPVDGASYHQELPRKMRPTDEMVLAVYNKASPRMQCMMDVAVMCGCRRQDILRLSLQEVDKPDDAGGGVRIVNWKQLEKAQNQAIAQHAQGKRRSPTLSDQEREPFIRFYPYADAPELRAAIARALELRKATIRGKRHAAMRLFVSEDGKALSETAFNSEWRRLKASEGLQIGAHEYHFHDHRRVTKTQADKAGIVAFEVLGHIDNKTTEKHYDADRKVLTAVPPVRKAK